MPTNSRTCGECSACCTALGVPSIEKRSYEPCRHQVGAGCAIYADRPAECRAFACSWLTDSGEHLRDDERPDESGIVVTIPELSPALSKRLGAPLAVVYEVYEGAAQQYRGEKILKRLERYFLIAVVWQDRRRLRIGPRHKLTPETIELLLGPRNRPK